jgi:glucosamine kinase
MPLGLGVDVGGTSTRWALVDAAHETLAQGETSGFTGLLAGTPQGRQEIATALAELAQAVHDAARGQPSRIYAGITGHPDDPQLHEDLVAQWAAAFGLTAREIVVVGDLELAYRDAFDPGEGFLVYAGTGSFGVHIDTAGQLHRVGGRGALLDDAGSGHWIASRALRAIWRAEDLRPGAWRASPLACGLFERLGGAHWSSSRDFIYQSPRGRVGELARVVAAAAESDPLARDILCRAGTELARLANALSARFGARPVALAGRAASLHPCIATSLRAALSFDVVVRRAPMQPHRRAARLALETGGLAGPGAAAGVSTNPFRA